jgi:hypothetical protein
LNYWRNIAKKLNLKLAGSIFFDSMCVKIKRRELDEKGFVLVGFNDWFDGYYLMFDGKQVSPRSAG